MSISGELVCRRLYLYEHELEESNMYINILFDRIDYRYANKAVFYTSSIIRDKTKDAGVDNRTADRFSEMISIEMFMEGESLRSRA